jgi:invasion protein IalB
MAAAKKRQYGWIVGIAAIGVLIGWVVRGAVNQPHYVLTISNYQDWRLSCNQQAGADAACQLTQEVIDRKTRTSIVRLVLWHQKGSPMVSLVVPVNVLLPPGIGLGVGKKPVKTIAYKTCDQGGCLASVAADQALYDAVVNASEIHVVIASLAGKSVQIALSSKGLHDGENAMRDTEADSRSWLRRALL